MQHSESILLRKTRYSETSLILSWLTLSHGMIRTMARGVLRRGNAMGNVLDLYREGTMAWIPSSRGDLHAFKEFEVHHSREGWSYEKLKLGAYFGRLIEMTCEPEAPVPECYELLSKVLVLMDPVPRVPLSWLLRFETRLCEALGIQRPGEEGAWILLDTYHRLPSERDSLVKELQIVS